MDTQEIASNIARKVDEIVDETIEQLTDEAKDRGSFDAEDLDQAAWEIIDSHEWVNDDYKAKLIATDADLDAFKAEYGSFCRTPKMLALFHLIERVRGDERYQELHEKL